MVGCNEGDSPIFRPFELVLYAPFIYSLGQPKLPNKPHLTRVAVDLRVCTVAVLPVVVPDRQRREEEEHSSNPRIPMETRGNGTNGPVSTQPNSFTNGSGGSFNFHMFMYKNWRWNELAYSKGRTNGAAVRHPGQAGVDRRRTGGARGFVI